MIGTTLYITVKIRGQWKLQSLIFLLMLWSYWMPFAALSTGQWLARRAHRFIKARVAESK